jgi:hypothetical protein
MAISKECRCIDKRINNGYKGIIKEKRKRSGVRNQMLFGRRIIILHILPKRTINVHGKK